MSGGFLQVSFSFLFLLLPARQKDAAHRRATSCLLACSPARIRPGEASPSLSHSLFPSLCLLSSLSLYLDWNPNPKPHSHRRELKSPVNGGVHVAKTLSTRFASPSSSRWCKPLVPGAAGGEERDRRPEHRRWTSSSNPSPP